MAFPQTILPLITEMAIGGVMTDVSADRHVEGGLTITRGRADWGSRVVASRCSQSFLNPTGVYSNRLPTSPNFRKLGQGTEIRHRVRWVRDTFSRSVSSSWGSTPEGYAWSITGGGAASEYLVQGTKGIHTHPSVEVRHITELTLPAATSDVTALVNISATATGGSIFVGVATGSDGSNCYVGRLEFMATGNVRLRVIKRIAGAESDVSTEQTIGTYAGVAQFWVRIQCRPGGLIRSKAWPVANAEPAAWSNVSRDKSLSTFTKGLCISHRSSLNTNSSPTAAFDVFEVNDYRFWGRTSASAPTWDLSGKKVLAPFEATGILQQLTSPDQPVLSAMRRTIANAGPVAYYPLEDGEGTTQFASAFPGAAAAAATWFGARTVEAAAASTLTGSAPVPAIHPGTSVSLPVSSYTDTGTLRALIPFYMPKDTPGVDIHLFHVNDVETQILVLPGTSPLISVSGGPQGGADLWSAIDFSTPLDDLLDRWLLLEITGTAAGSWTVRIWNGSTAVRTFTGTSAAAYANVKSILLSTSVSTTAGLPPCYYGHPALYNSAVDISVTTSAMAGWPGETAAERMTRVCAEDGIPFFLMDSVDATSDVGPQPTTTTAEILFLAAETDLGILHEPRDAYGIAYRPRTTLYDQTGVSLDYGNGQIHAPSLPTEDDQTLINDAIARRVNGSFARVTIAGGPLGTASKVGRQPEDKTWNAARDDQLAGIAGWRTRLGTWDEARYPVLRTNLAAPDVAGSPALVGAIAAVDLSDMVIAANPPAWLPPEDVELLAEGSTEYFGDGREWDIAWNCSPAGPWNVYQYGATASDVDPLTGRYGGKTLQLAASVNTTATAWAINADPLFTTTGAHFTPAIRAMCGGEEIAITNATGTGPQTLTVVRSINGVVKPHNPSDPNELDIVLLDNAVYVP